jgi:hypothetical protein
VAHTLTVREYFHALLTGAAVIMTRVALWVLLGILAYRPKPSGLLLVTWIAAALHFLLFPSAEDRYLVWAYIITAIVLIRSWEGSEPSPQAV